MSQKAISLQQLSDYLTSYLAINKFNEKAYNGIQIANQQPIAHIATAVSASLETIQKATDIGAQALLVHHGLFLKSHPHPITGMLYKKVKRLMDHDCALLGYHLPLDAHQEIGNNWQAARDLGLENLEPFCEIDGNYIGVIGTLPPRDFKQFKEDVESYYGRPAQSVQIKDTIESVAIVSGGADRWIKDAAEAGADCFITGRVDEPVYDHAHEENISFLGLGHYGTEVIGPRALGEHLKEKFGIQATFIHTDNPF